MKLLKALPLALVLWPAMAQAQMDRLRECLSIEDMSKERLNCYDAVLEPQPSARAAKQPKTVANCRQLKEEDERLTCFNRFVDKPAAPPKKKRARGKRKAAPPPAAAAQ